MNFKMDKNIVYFSNLKYVWLEAKNGHPNNLKWLEAIWAMSFG